MSELYPWLPKSAAATALGAVGGVVGGARATHTPRPRRHAPPGSTRSSREPTPPQPHPNATPIAWPLRLSMTSLARRWHRLPSFLTTTLTLRVTGSRTNAECKDGEGAKGFSNDKVDPAAAGSVRVVTHTLHTQHTPKSAPSSTPHRPPPTPAPPWLATASPAATRALAAPRTPGAYPVHPPGLPLPSLAPLASAALSLHRLACLQVHPSACPRRVRVTCVF